MLYGAIDESRRFLPSGGGARTKRSPERRPRRGAAAAGGGLWRCESTEGEGEEGEVQRDERLTLEACGSSAKMERVEAGSEGSTELHRSRGRRGWRGQFAASRGDSVDEEGENDEAERMAVFDLLGEASIMAASSAAMAKG